MAQPIIVQSAFARIGVFTTTALTLPSVPAVGNWIVAFVTGYWLNAPSGAVTPNSDLALFASDLGALNANEATWFYYKQIAAADVADPGAHRYWRMYCDFTQQGSSGPSMAEITMASSAGGANLIGTGTPSASAVNGTHTAASAVDGNAATFWDSGSTTGTGWWAYDFGAANPVAVREVKITSRNDTLPLSSPGIWELQYSDDSTNWTTCSKFNASTWTLGSQQTFDLKPQVIWPFTSGISASYHNIALFEISGVSNILTPRGVGVSGTTTTIGPLTASSDPNALRMVMATWIQATSITSAAPTGWTLLSPTTGWQSDANSQHTAIWQVPASEADSQTLTFAASSGGPVWYDIQILTTTPPMRTTQIGAESWEVGNPAAQFSQVGAEAWAPGVPQARVSQLGVEVWRSTADFMYVAPTAVPMVMVLA